jgi:gluconolactonase
MRTSSPCVILLAAALPAQFHFHAPAGRDLFADGAEVEVLAADRQFCEGPTWLASEQALLFSDIPKNQWLRWTAAGGVVVWKESAGANGNTLDQQGRLLSCQHGARNIVRHEAAGTLTVLAAAFADKPLNSPNDVAVRCDGTIWFTDPTYGLGRRQREQAGNHVYRLDPATAALVVVQRDFDQPNGLCFAPDHARLYIADSGRPQRIGAFPVQADGTLGAAAFWLEGGADGMRCDHVGNLYATCKGGLRVFSPAGVLLAEVDLAPTPTNCAFGGKDGTELFVTARTHLYRIAMRVRGAPMPAVAEVEEKERGKGKEKAEGKGER